MKKGVLILMMTFLGLTGFWNKSMAQEKSARDTLVVVWTSGDIDVANKLVFMYVFNAKKAKWFDEVIFVVWGPSQKLLSENEELQGEVEKMKEIGIKVEACVVCAKMYCVDTQLGDMGIDVKGMGRPLSEYLKKGYSVISF